MFFRLAGRFVATIMTCAIVLLTALYLGHSYFDPIGRFRIALPSFLMGLFFLALLARIGLSISRNSEPQLDTAGERHWPYCPAYNQEAAIWLLVFFSFASFLAWNTKPHAPNHEPIATVGAAFCVILGGSLIVEARCKTERILALLITLEFVKATASQFLLMDQTIQRMGAAAWLLAAVIAVHALIQRRFLLQAE